MILPIFFFPIIYYSLSVRVCFYFFTSFFFFFCQSEVFGNFQGAVQYNLMSSHPYVSEICTAINDEVNNGGSSLDALAAATSLFYDDAKRLRDDQCIGSSFEEDYIAFLSDTAFSEIGCNLTCTSDRQWIWQSCNEFGYFQTANTEGGSTNPFAAFTQLNIDTAVSIYITSLPVILSHLSSIVHDRAKQYVRQHSTSPTTRDL